MWRSCQQDGCEEFCVRWRAGGDGPGAALAGCSVKFSSSCICTWACFRSAKDLRICRAPLKPISERSLRNGSPDERRLTLSSASTYIRSAVSNGKPLRLFHASLQAVRKRELNGSGCRAEPRELATEATDHLARPRTSSRPGRLTAISPSVAAVLQASQPAVGGVSCRMGARRRG